MTTRTLLDTLQHFVWFNEPDTWHLDEYLEITTDPNTDYWQRTHYGFRHDNGHFFFANQVGDFNIRACFAFFPCAQYDQCGLMCRVDSENWIKCSMEYETPTFSRLGSVVTNVGYSDWATQDIPSTQKQMWYSISRRGDDFLIEWSREGCDWHQMRIAHLHRCPDQVQIGVYACSPKGGGFVCRVHDIQMDPNQGRNTV